MAPSFLKGDILITVRCDVCYSMPPEQQRRALTNVAKLIDCVSNVWMQERDICSCLCARTPLRLARQGSLSTPRAPPCLKPSPGLAV